MKKASFIVFLQWWIFLFLGCAFAADFQAKVIHIADGDTITVLNANNDQIKIRLNGIDCPEKAQAFGNKAKQLTNDLVHGEMVTIQTHGQEQIWSHHWRCDLRGWSEPESGIGEGGVCVLVSEVCAGRYHPKEIRDRSKGGKKKDCGTIPILFPLGPFGIVVD